MAPTRPSLLVGLSLMVIAVLTLGPAPPTAPSTALCLFCGALGGVDFALNLALFVPLGLGLRLRLGRALPAIAIGAAVTMTIELLQMRVIPGRDAALGDLVANTIGTAVGAWIASRGATWLNGHGQPARLRAWVVTAFVAIVLAGTSIALLPVPTKYLLWVQWTPRRQGMDPFPTQRLLSAELNGAGITKFEELPPDRLQHEGTSSVRLTLDGPIPPTVRRSIIVRLANSPAEGLFVGQEREALLFRVFSLASWHKFRTLLVRLDGAFQPGSTGPFTADLVATRRAVTVSVTDRLGTRRTTVRRTPGLGWTVLLPWDLAIDNGWWVVTSAWLAALFLPTAFFAARSRVPDESAVSAAWGPIAALALALVVVPTALGISLPGWPEWLGVVAGVAGGVLAANLTSRGRRERATG